MKERVFILNRDNSVDDLIDGEVRLVTKKERKTFMLP